MTPDEATHIEADLRPLIGLAAWRVELGHGSFVTLDFGNPIEKRGATYGEWHLWVYGCAWRIDNRDAMVAGSNDDRAVLATAVKILENKPLTAFSVAAPAGQARLNFEGDVVLHMFPCSSEMEHFKLFMPGGDVLLVGPADEWRVGR